MYRLRIADSQNETLGLVLVDHDGWISDSWSNESAIRNANAAVVTVVGRDDLGAFTVPADYNADDVDEAISALLERQGQLIDY